MTDVVDCQHGVSLMAWCEACDDEFGKGVGYWLSRMLPTSGPVEQQYDEDGWPKSGITVERRADRPLT